MKNFHSNSGPFAERPHFDLREIERICTDELRAAGLYPTTPQAIRIDRFIERRFGVSPAYESLPEGVLGFTRFGPKGVEAIIVAKSLDNYNSKATERRLRTTLAHEGGHGLLHAHLFPHGEKPKSLFDDGDTAPRILCREVLEGPRPKVGYNGRWWEFQANRAIGGLLMPRLLVEKTVDEFCVQAGMLGGRTIPSEKKDSAVQALSTTFDVNPAVARIRLEEMFPARNDGQMHL
jgi:hypothetical protein